MCYENEIPTQINTCGIAFRRFLVHECLERFRTSANNDEKKPR
jgi:hypothetical protein